MRCQELMTRRVFTARADQLLSELIQMFSGGGLHHIPVVDSQDGLVGMVAQSDLVGVLTRGREGGMKA